jgi:hypothetical protein
VILTGVRDADKGRSSKIAQRKPLRSKVAYMPTGVAHISTGPANCPLSWIRFFAPRELRSRSRRSQSAEFPALHLNGVVEHDTEAADVSTSVGGAVPPLGESVKALGVCGDGG